MFSPNAYKMNIRVVLWQLILDESVKNIEINEHYFLSVQS